MPKQKYTSEFKVRTVLEGLKTPDSIAAFCRRKGISEVQFYGWQKQMIENAESVFHKPSKAQERKVSEMEADLKRKDEIIAVVTEEALELKKKLRK